ncbi:MAG TPA: hypothetical protein DIS79_02830 [Bacteroidetes bacterium]|nr:hypothetical protein [Bacteroidota bacterium]HRK05911.1 hypothetical protein [Chlorobiota bacterium]
MRTSDDLFRLIHSLSRTEKGYFRKYCARHVIGGENDYVALFDALESMDTFDEAKLKALLGDHPAAKRLAASKHYLFQQILEAMRLYHASSSTERQIVELLEDADFLWEKALYDLAMRRVTKARELAVAHDEYAFWLKTISWYKNYRHVVLERPESDGSTDPLSKEQLDVMNLLKSTIEYEELGNLFHYHLLRSTHGDADGSSARWIAQLGEHELLQDIEKANSRPARLNFHLALSNWHYYHTHNTEAALYHAQALLDMMEADPEIAAARPDWPLTFLQMWLQRNIEAGRYDAYLTRIDDLWADHGKRPTRNIEVKRFFRAMNTEAVYALRSGDVTRIDERYDFIRTRYAALRERIPAQSRIAGAFLYARLFADASRWTEAGHWLRYVGMEDDELRPDLHAAARIIRMRQATVEGDRDLLRTTSRSLKRFLSVRNMATSRTEAALSLFRRLSDVLTPIQRRSLFDEIRRRLDSHPTTDPFDPIGSAGLHEWLDVIAPPRQER